MAEVRIVVKAGSGYADPWVTVVGHDREEVKPGVNGGDPYVEQTVTAAEDASKSLQELRELGAFSAIKLISQEFAGAPAAGVESVKAVFTDAEVISDVPIPEAGPPHPPPPPKKPPITPSRGPPQTSAHPGGVVWVMGVFPDAYLFWVVPSRVSAPPPAPPEQSYPACTQCGAPTKPRSGTGGNGVAYSGFACTKVRTHFDLTK